MNALKNEGMWVMAGGLLGAGALAILSDQQVVTADHWATITGLIASGVAVAAVAFKAALKKKQG